MDMNNWPGMICGISEDNHQWAPSTLINNVRANGGILRLSGENLILFDNILSQFVKADATGYQDGYSCNIYDNGITKINGIDFEDRVEEAAGTNLSRNSSAVFTIDKQYEREADFIMTFSNKPLEVKNCINMKSFINTRKHNALYAITNDRENNTFRLVCKLTKDDKTHLEDFETYENYKVIKDWFWVVNLRKIYTKYRLNYSWQFIEGFDAQGRYLDIISPEFSTTKEAKFVRNNSEI